MITDEHPDIDKVNEIYNFLQGNQPDSTRVSLREMPKLSAKKAFTIIWFLQEHLRIIPDSIEQCDSCKELFDSNSEGVHWEAKGKHFCGCCMDQAPYNIKQ